MIRSKNYNMIISLFFNFYRWATNYIFVLSLSCYHFNPVRYHLDVFFCYIFCFIFRLELFKSLLVLIFMLSCLAFFYYLGLRFIIFFILSFFSTHLLCL
jgi:hypothetical protein